VHRASAGIYHLNHHGHEDLRRDTARPTDDIITAGGYNSSSFRSAYSRAKSPFTIWSRESTNQPAIFIKPRCSSCASSPRALICFWRYTTHTRNNHGACLSLFEPVTNAKPCIASVGPSPNIPHRTRADQAPAFKRSLCYRRPVILAADVKTALRSFKRPLS
jgi:hypothetical protein